MNIPPNVDFNDYVSLVGELEAQEIHSAGRWADDLVERSKGVQSYGDKLPWSKTWDGGMRFRPGEVPSGQGRMDTARVCALAWRRCGGLRITARWRLPVLR
jgi:hypothetical protein